jgi:hypothetical protein
MKPGLQICTAAALAAMMCILGLTVACKSEKTSQAAQTQNAPQTPQNQAPLSIDDLVAPIALYPDQLLGQVLTASMNPQEVLDGGNWLIQNQTLKGDALTNAAKQAGFSPSMQYLTNFPQVVDNMCQEMDWTTQLGEAFKTDQKGVMAAVQAKRMQAQQVGNLTSTPQMTVATQTDNGQQYVEIKPADPKVVYVPQYNPVTIYNTPAPAAPATTTTTTTEKSGVSTGAAVGIGLLSFGVGMAIGHAINNNDNYYPYPAWGYGGMYYGGRPYYPPPYRPVYPGYRPAPYYRPPANYQWSQYNRNVNVNVNNNYYNRYHNTNVRGGLSTTARPVQQPSWKGQSTYQGAHPQVGNQRAGAGMSTALSQNAGNRGVNNQMATNRNGNQMATRDANRSNFGNAAGSGNRQALGSGVQPAANREAMRPNNAGGGDMNRPGASANTMARSSPPPNLNRGGDRGYSTPASSSGRTASQNPAPQNRKGGAFGSEGGGQATRDASNRGRSSMGASPRGGGGRRSR